MIKVVYHAIMFETLVFDESDDSIVSWMEDNTNEVIVVNNDVFFKHSLTKTERGRGDPEFLTPSKKLHMLLECKVVIWIALANN